MSIHPDSNKMYQDWKTHFWWTKMKKEIAAYVARCEICWITSAIAYPRLEMGGNKYGLYYRPSDDTARS